jgi:microcystin degradation protein MlrC
MTEKKSSKRVFIASIANETNTFSPLRVSLQDFHDSFYAGPGQHPAEPTLCSAVFPVARRIARQYSWELIEGTACWSASATVMY